jgi:CheY-like chemotaxis protein
MHILVVEDDTDVADFVRRGLKEEGNSVQVAHDGGVALQQALEHPFDSIVLDVMLPFLDGFEVTRRLRSHRNRTPVLLLNRPRRAGIRGARSRCGTANGVYADPESTSGENLPQDWIDFVAAVIERSRKIRQHIEAAPHQLENA